MKLYDLHKGAKIFCEASDGSTYVIFDHIDGMYSYCVTEKGAVVHLAAFTPLKATRVDKEAGFAIDAECPE